MMAFRILLVLLLTARVAFAAEATVDALVRQIRQHPGDIRSIYRLGRLHFRNGQHEQAIRLFRHLLEKSPRRHTLPLKVRVDLLNRIALCHYRLKDWPMAAEYWEAALKLDPKNKFANKGLGIVKRPPPPPPPPPPDPAVAAKAFEEGKKLYEAALARAATADDEETRAQFARAREKLAIAARGADRKAEAHYLLGMCGLKGASDDPAELEKARESFEAAYRLASGDKRLAPDITFGLAATCGLLDDVASEIEYYEKTLELKPGFAEAHFRAALAYDKDKSEGASAKCFRHATRAVKLDGRYKKELQPLIRNSRVAQDVTRIIKEIVDKSENSTISEEEADRYADQIGKILGTDELNGETLGDEAGGSRQQLKEAIQDPQKRKELQKYWDAETYSK